MWKSYSFNIILILLCICQIFLVPEEYELKSQFLYCLKSCIKSEGLIEKITTLILRNPSLTYLCIRE